MSSKRSSKQRCSRRKKQAKPKSKQPKKPKFMSLKSHLSPPPPSQTPPQHPPTEPSELDNDCQVARLLEVGNEPHGGASITDLFVSSTTTSSSAAVDEVLSPASPPSVGWDGEGLARRALRGRERWVFCKEEVSDVKGRDFLWCSGVQKQGLQLKLDYEEVMTAWSDRGPLYIDGEGPQIVPELGCQHNRLFVEVGSAASGMRVPEMEVEGKEGRIIEENKMNREERVMRYKAKRQSRLFSKRIRYEVRKLNAEKRPRLKGRFVKRIDDM